MTNGTLPISFGIVAEGLTDQIVIKHILEGVFGKEGETIKVAFVQPPNDATTQGSSDPPPGGWTLVVGFLESGEYKQAALFNDFLVVQIDTDISQDPGFNVPHHHEGKELSVMDLESKVRAKLEGFMDDEDVDTVIMAIAVHSLECWLLPLASKQAKTRAKIKGCLQAANYELKRSNRDQLKVGDNKDPRAYEKLSRAFRKPRSLNTHAPNNPSLGIFVERLRTLATREDIDVRLEHLRAERGE